jgi:hypothetical protein
MGLLTEEELVSQAKVSTSRVTSSQLGWC